MKTVKPSPRVYSRASSCLAAKFMPSLKLQKFVALDKQAILCYNNANR